MKISVLPGDGIGPEITEASVKVLQALDKAKSLGLRFEWHEVGLSRLKRDGSTCPPEVLEAARRSDGILLGPISHAVYPSRAEGGINLSAELRISLDLYANIRPSRTREGLPYWGKTAMDLVIVRENTEGFYSDRNMFLGPGELMPTPDLALSIRKVTAASSRRIAHYGCELAMKRKRKVTVVHKANVLKHSEGLFLKEARDVARRFDLVYEEQLVDSMAALLIRQADQFDVVITTNMFGDILSDEAAELSGGLGLGGSINAGDEHCMAQAAHGSAPDIAGKDRANPTSLILSTAMMLDWMGRKHQQSRLVDAAVLLEQTIDEVLSDPSLRTVDLGGPLGTGAFTAVLCEKLR